MRLGTLEELEIQYSQALGKPKPEAISQYHKATRIYTVAHNCHGKSKSLTAKANRSRQKQINSMPYFYQAEYTNLVWSVYILLVILQFAEEFLVLARQYNNRDQKNPVSTIFIRNLEMKSARSCVRVRFYIYKYVILAVTREARVNGNHGVNRCSTVKSSNTSFKAERLTSAIKISHSELIFLCRV